MGLHESIQIILWITQTSDEIFNETKLERRFNQTSSKALPKFRIKTSLNDDKNSSFLTSLIQSERSSTLAWNLCNLIFGLLIQTSAWFSTLWFTRHYTTIWCKKDNFSACEKIIVCMWMKLKSTFNCSCETLETLLFSASQGEFLGVGEQNLNVGCRSVKVVRETINFTVDNRRVEFSSLWQEENDWKIEQKHFVNHRLSLEFQQNSVNSSLSRWANHHSLRWPRNHYALAFSPKRKKCSVEWESDSWNWFS